jgi:ABC-type transport system involved in multi-copper enzyme maturation permease subunit
LLFLYVTFGEVTGLNPGKEVSHRVLAEVGIRFYRAFRFYQLLAVLILSPVYAVTSISEEKVRRTLPYLLASRLRDDEIVLGKIGLAVLRVWEVLLCGLPLCALCLLLGGVTPEFMALDFVVAMSAALASCALGVLASILSRRLSEALLIVLLLQFVWYILPVADTIGRAAATGFYVPSELLELNGFVAIYRGQMAGAVGRWEAYGSSVAAMLICGYAWSFIAWFILRPAWRREEQGTSVSWLFKAIRRPRPVQKVWDQPWLWRELRSRRATSVDRIVWALYLFVAIGVLSGIAINWDTTVKILITPPASAPPPSLIIAMYSLILYVALLMLPYLAIVSATSFAEEHDGGHLDLLCITLLDQRDLVHAKLARLAILGAGIVAMPIVLETLILIMGWATVWAWLLTSLHCLAATAFWLTLGLAVSIHVQKTSKALILALSLVLAGMASGPLILSLIGHEEAAPLAMISTPFHCVFLQITDNHVEPERMQSWTVESLRILSLLFTLGNVVGAIVCYVWALRPAPPWQAAHAFWLPDTITSPRPIRQRAPQPVPPG